MIDLYIISMLHYSYLAGITWIGLKKIAITAFELCNSALQVY